MKFEHINNQLCLMTEPVPLTEKAQFPCVVRLIQDDSPMGRYNQSYSEYRYGVRLGCCMLPIIATHIAKNGVVNDIEWDVNRYEILGYPVADGSVEWALYRMMQGDKVTKWHLEHHIYWHYDARPHLQCISEYNCGTLQIMVSPEIWIKTADKDGWQLYEPKEETKKASAVNPLENGFYAVTTVDPIPFILEWYCGEWIWPDGTMTEFEFPSDIISYVLVERNQSLIDKPLSNPAHRFKVGDWVRTAEGDGAIIGIPLTMPDVKLTNGKIGSFHADEIFKLSSAEVMIHIGCLSGTVRKSSTGGDYFRLFGVDGEASIDFVMLDTPTLELVESLLKAQEKGE